MEKLEIKILSYVWYNQIQAHNFWLNQNQAIIMNYLSLVLPSYAESIVILWKTYFWGTLSKGLKDMPTLNIKETTMRTNINELITLWLLEREIVTVENKQRAYYRVTRKWLEEWNYNYPSDFNSLLMILESKFWDGTFKPTDLERLKKFIEWKKVSDRLVEYDIDWIDWDEFATHIINELVRWKDWLNIKEKIDADFIQEIMEHIVSIWKLRAWYKTWFDWKADQMTVNKMKDKFTWMINWSIKNRKIKDLKLTIDTWFKKDYI